jgi:hypothetical protein
VKRRLWLDEMGGRVGRVRSGRGCPFSRVKCDRGGSAGLTRLVYISQAAEVSGRRAVAAVDPARAHEQHHTSRRHRAAAANT